mgnify:CR=1 FL=1
MGIFKEVTDEEWKALNFRPKSRRSLWNKAHNYAHQKVAQAKRVGTLIEPMMCEACGYMGSLHAHHEDYDKPYDVMWLCPECHRSLHQSKREGMC